MLDGYAVRVEPATRHDPEWAAIRWRRGEGLSLADRLCLALTDRFGVQVLTADSVWGSQEPIVQIR